MQHFNVTTRGARVLNHQLRHTVFGATFVMKFVRGIYEKIEHLKHRNYIILHINKKKAHVYHITTS